MSYKARIKFDNREWLVIDNVEYQGVKYFYIIEDISDELESLPNMEDYQGNFSLEFIYKEKGEIYKNVTDQNLISKLSAIVAIKLLSSK